MSFYRQRKESKKKKKTNPHSSSGGHSEEVCRLWARADSIYLDYPVPMASLLLANGEMVSCHCSDTLKNE